MTGFPGHESKTCVLTVASGKGGVGKTLVSTHLALAFVRAGYRTALVDGDTGLANVAIALGLETHATLYALADDVAPIDDFILRHPSGLHVVAGRAGEAGPTGLTPAVQRRMVDGVSHRLAPLDFLIVDTAAGVSEDTMGFLQQASDVLLVISPDPASFMDAYAIIKLMAARAMTVPVHVIANMVASQRSGILLFEQLERVVARFLDCRISYEGAVRMDSQVGLAAQRCATLFDLDKMGPAAIDLSLLATAIARRHAARDEVGHARTGL